MNKRAILENRTRIFLVLFLAVMVVFWIWGYFVSRGIVEDVVSLVKNYSGDAPFIAGLIFWLFAALSVLLGPFTSGPVIPVAVLIWGNNLTFVLLLTGWIAGDIFAYLIGKYAGYKIVKKILSEEEIGNWRNFVFEKATFFVAFLFRLAMPAETGYVFGLAKYRFIKYLFITLIVETLFASILVFASNALITRDLTNFVILIVASFVILIYATYLLSFRVRKLQR